MSLKKRLIIIAYIVSITLSVFIFAFSVERYTIDIDYTAFTRCEESDGHIYFSQNERGKGLLFDISYKGYVSRIFNSKDFGEDRVSAVSINGENIYLVLSSFIEPDKNDENEDFEPYTVYRLVSLDRKFRVKLKSERFYISDDEVISGFSAENNGMFITMLGKDGSYLRVYSIDPKALKEEDKLDGEDIKVDSVRSKRAQDGRFFVQALFQAGELYVRTDKDAPTGVFEVNENAENAMEIIKMSIGQFLSLYSSYVIRYIAGCIIWLIVITLLFRLLYNRNRMFYLAATLEVVLALVTGVGIMAVTGQWKEARQTEHSRYAVISMLNLADEADIQSANVYGWEGFYDTDAYQVIKKRMVDFIRLEGNRDIFYDVLYVRLSDNMVVASASGRNLQKLTSIYGDKCINLDYSIYRGSRYAAQDIRLEGQEYRLVAVADGVGATNYAIVGLINSTSTDPMVWVDNSVIIVLFVLFFALGSAFIMAICYLQTRDFRKLETALSDTALGRRIYERPVEISKDLKEMWNSILELNKRVEELQYSKLRILEAYYRFAPKNIEKILLKESIIEVDNGESIETSGTIAMLGIHFFSTADIAKLSSVLEDIGGFHKEHRVILAGKAPDMSKIQFLFMDSELGTVDFFTQMFNNNIKSGERVNFSTVLFYDNCRFGVLGNENEAATYLYCDKKRLMEQISQFITNLGIGLVITEEVMVRERVSGPTRFIGYMGQDRNGEKIKLYEVLDACPAVIRKQKMANLKKFGNALSQFYEKDFYLSRTSFSEILKDAPNDLLVKWYVFESDRYLNEYVSGEEYMYLHN